MKIVKLLVFSILIIIFNLNSAFSVVCCYSGDGLPPITRSSDDFCDSTQINLSLNTNDNDVCGGWEDERLYCQTPDGTCYSKLPALDSSVLEIGGSYLIYDVPRIKNSLDSSQCTLVEKSACGSIVNTIPTNVPTVGPDGSLNPTDSSSGDPDTAIPVDDLIDYDSTYDRDLAKKCVNAGGKYGFFVDEISCQKFENCIFNPNYKLSTLGTFISFYDTTKLIPRIIGLSPQSLETACVSGFNLKTCNDLKSKSLCENPSSSVSLSDDCRWVESSEYLTNSNTFSNVKGICVSKSVSDKKSFLSDKYFLRGGNQIKNPSFEDFNSFSNWKTSGSVNSFEIISYHLNNSVILTDENSYIEQDIFFPESESKFTFYVFGGNFDSQDQLIMEVSELDENNNLIGNSHQYHIDLQNYNESKFYNVIVGNSGNFFFPKNPDVYNLSFKIISKSKIPVIIDAISYSKETLFEPISIISSDASSCNLCFDEFGLNTCTQNKSNILGDCSYMVKDLSEKYEQSSTLISYSGTKENVKFNNEDTKWKSQSIANSQIFCEMYVHNNVSLQGGCENPNNYINKNYAKLHPNAQNNKLCKWNSNFGCFKDSDNNNKIDTIEIPIYNFSHPNVRIYNSLFNSLASFQVYNNYRYEKDNTGINIPLEKLSKSTNLNTYRLSDFALGCDIVPPVTYAYLKGKNASNHDVIINNNEVYNQGILGNVSIYIDIEDFIPESCEPYFNKDKPYKDKVLFLDYGVNGNYSLKYLGGKSKYFLNGINVKDFFIDSNQDPLYSRQNSNQLSLIVYDQSGNKGKEFFFGLDKMDLTGPQIELTSHTTSISFNSGLVVDNVLGKKSILNFSIQDQSSQNISCSFKFEPVSNIDSTLYDPTTKFFKGKSILNYSINITDYIFDSSKSSGDAYNFEMSCIDIFGQTSNEKYYIIVDLDTSIVLEKPQPHTESGNMYIGSTTDFIAYSSEISLNSCNLDFVVPGFLASPSLDIDSFAVPYNHPVHGEVYQNITGTLEFDENLPGYKGGQIICEDSVNNRLVQNLSLYYDNIEPEIIIIKPVNIQNEEGENTTYYDSENNIYYSTDSFADIEVIFNGTFSPVDNITNISMLDLNGNLNEDATKSLDYDTPIFNHNYSTFISSALFEDSNISFLGNNFIEDDLYLKNISFEFQDMAKNSNVQASQYYLDRSIPRFVHGGDIENIDINENKLYISKSDPVFNFTFNTPQYRTWDCDVSFNVNVVGTSRLKGPISFNDVNKLSFTTQIVGESLSKSEALQNKIESLNLRCVDVYNKVIEESYSIIYDETYPELESIQLKNGNDRYMFYNNFSFELDDLIDNLEFNLKDTGEDKYVCSYWFESDIYNCTSEKFEKRFDGTDNPKETEFLNIILDNPSESQSICIRGEKFEQLKQLKLDKKESFPTQIKVSAYCLDSANKQTQLKSENIDITYYDDDELIIDLKFEIESGNVIPIITTLYKTDLAISLNGGLENALLIIDKNDSEEISDEFGGSLFKYTLSQSSIPIEKFEGIGNILVYAIAFHDSANEKIIDDSLAKNLYIDTELPIGNLNIPGEKNGDVFSNSFAIEFEGFDSQGELDRLELYIKNSSNEILLYNSANKFINDQYLIDTEQDLLITGSQDNPLKGIAYFKQANTGSTYTFILKVYDKANNMKKVEKIITIREGVGIILENSNNAFVDPLTDSFWVTQNTSPTLNFLTSREVSKCAAKPHNNSQFKSFIELTASSQNPKEFSINTNTIFSGFDLTTAPNNKIEISCERNAQEYTYEYEIRIINSIPDYVLKTDSLIVNEFPYTKDIEIKSVGAYRPISCSYDVNNESFKQIDSISETLFILKQDFSSYPDSNISFKLQCENILGTQGPEKEYMFKVNQNEPFEISNITLSNNYFKSKYYQNENTIYISELGNWDLEFKLNKKKDITCRYNIDSNTIFVSFIHFFKNLFNIGEEIVPTESNSFILKKEDLVFESDSTDLSINCENINVGSDEIDKTIEVLLYDEHTNVTDINILAQTN